MPEKTELARHIVLGSWSALFFLFVVQVTSRSGGYEPLVHWFYVLLLGVVLLVALNVAGSTQGVSRIALGLWLGLFLLYGLEDVQSIISLYGSSLYDWFPWLGYVVVALIIVVMVLVVALRPVTGLGAIALTISAGFLVVLANYALALVFPDTNRHAFGRADVRWLHLDWFGATFGHYLEHDWIRLITYTGLGYVVAKRAGWLLGVVSTIGVAFLDSILSWLVLIPYVVDSGFLDETLLYWPDFLRTIVIDTYVLACFGGIGIVISQIRWPKSFRASLANTIE